MYYILLLLYTILYDIIINIGNIYDTMNTINQPTFMDGKSGWRAFKRAC